MDNLIEKAKKLLHEANSGSYECKYYNDGFIDGVKYAEQQLKNCNLQSVIKSLPEYNEILYHAKTLTNEQFSEYWDEVQGNVL